MFYQYSAPLLDCYLLLELDGLAIQSLQMLDQEDYPRIKKDHPASLWLDDFFQGKRPSLNTLELKLQGTPFQKRIWYLLSTIPYGKRISYSQLAQLYQKSYHKKTSARACGRAVGSNPIAIMIPCHRVVAKDGSLCGYKYGLDKKKKLLDWEKDNS